MRTKLQEKWEKLIKKVQYFLSLNDFNQAYKIINEFKEENFLSLIGDDRVNKLISQINFAENEHKKLLELKNCDTNHILDYVYDGKTLNLEVLDYALERMQNEGINLSDDLIKIISLSKIDQYHKFEAINLMKKYNIKFRDFSLINELNEIKEIKFNNVEDCWLDFEDMTKGYYKEVYDEICKLLFKQPSLAKASESLLRKVMEKNFGLPDDENKNKLAQQIVNTVLRYFENPSFKN